ERGQVVGTQVETGHRALAGGVRDAALHRGARRRAGHADVDDRRDRVGQRGGRALLGRVLVGVVGGDRGLGGGRGGEELARGLGGGLQLGVGADLREALGEVGAQQVEVKRRAGGVAQVGLGSARGPGGSGNEG